MPVKSNCVLRTVEGREAFKCQRVLLSIQFLHSVSPLSDSNTAIVTILEAGVSKEVYDV